MREATADDILGWVTARSADERWPLAYVLAYAAWGTLKPLAPYVIAWEYEPLKIFGGGFTTVTKTLNDIAGSEFACFRPFPMRAVRAALESGLLAAMGRFRNVGDPVHIKPVCWPLLRLGPPMGGTGPAAFYENEGPNPDGYWTSLSFNRVEVLSFASAIDATPDPKAWRPRGEQVQEWAINGGEAELVARARITARNLRQTEAAICRELAAMWKEAPPPADARTGKSRPQPTWKTIKELRSRGR